MWLTKWSPLGISHLDRELNRLWERLFVGSRSGKGESFFAPALEAKEDEKTLYLSLELPGVKREDIEVNVKDGVLTIQAEKKAEARQENEEYVLNERQYGKFLRSLRLEERFNPEAVSAEYSEGVLKVKVDKHEQVKPKSIAVKVN